MTHIHTRRKHLHQTHSSTYHEIDVSLLTAKVIHQPLKAMLLLTHLKFKICSDKVVFLLISGNDLQRYKKE